MNCTRPVLERCKTGPVEVIERPCGVCPSCRAKKAQEWTYRLYAELKLHKKAVFVTLTYDEEHIKTLQQSSSGLYSLRKRDAQLFFKSLRDFIKPDKIRHYTVGEYGERTKRSHFHSIIFGLGPEDRDIIQKAWKNGFVACGTVTPSSIAYVARYCTKKLYQTGEEYRELGLEPEFTLISNRPGIGFNAIKKGLKRGDDGQYYVWFQGRKQGAPRYFKDKVRDSYDRFKGRCNAVNATDERKRYFADNGISEVETQLQSEKNRLAARRLRDRL